MRDIVAPLSPFFARSDRSARIFFTGMPCRNVDFDASSGVGYIHVPWLGSLRHDAP